jgi:hypothetical protein
MAEPFVENETLSLEQLDEMAQVVAKRSAKLRDEGGTLTEMLESLNERSEAAIANAKHIRETISAVHAAIAK